VLADAFEREVQRWREERMATVIVPDVGLASVTDSVVSVPDSIPVPEIPIAEPK
jgi:hypothetical protein